MISADIKRIAGPGRRSSNRRSKFPGDNLIEGIDYQPDDEDFFDDDADDETDEADTRIRPSDIQKRLETQSILDLNAQKRVTAELEALNFLEGTRAEEDAATERAQREMHLRATLAGRSRRESVKQEEEQLAIENAATAERTRQEQIAIEKAAAIERSRQEQIAIEKAAAIERSRQEQIAIEKAAAIERSRQEQIAIEKAAAIERSRQEQIAIEKAAAIERSRQEQIAIEKAAAIERSRQEQIQKDREMEKLKQEEEEAEEQRQLAAAISAERDRRDAEEKQEAFMKSQQAESPAAEFERKKAERRAVNEFLMQEEANRTALEAKAVLDAITAERAQNYAAQKMKREAFLSDMNSFSQTIEGEAAKVSQARTASASSAIYQQYRAPAVRFEDQSSTTYDPITRSQYELSSSNNDSNGWDENIDSHATRQEGVNSFKELTSSLLAANNMNTASNARQSSEVDNNCGHRDIWGESTAYSNIHGNREVEGFTGHNESGRNNFQDVKTHRTNESNQNRSRTPVEEIEEEEGMGGAASISNILTMDERKVLSVEQRVAWKALQADLTTRRKEFHGAVTYAFDGIFSWQMYGSTEAAEEGKPYTEYLMRCQWGTTWENMQPWIVARRYREFDVLNFQLRRSFPSQANVIHTLPEKCFFTYMDAHVVEKRRRALEDYMTRIVQRLPTVVRSRTLDDFLGITDRIKTIRSLLGPDMSLLSSHSHSPYQSHSQHHTQSQPFTQQHSHIQSQQHTQPYTQSAPSSSHVPVSYGIGSRSRGGNGNELPGGGDDASVSILSVEHAERVRDRDGALSLEEESLSCLEEDIKDLGVMLNMASPLDISKPGRLRDLLRSTTARWPRLRATAILGGGTGHTGRDSSRDFCLIPRALQAEEDLLRISDNYRSLSFAGSLM